MSGTLYGLLGKYGHGNLVVIALEELSLVAGGPPKILLSTGQLDTRRRRRRRRRRRPDCSSQLAVLNWNS